jgi:hypothetical protein
MAHDEEDGPLGLQTGIGRRPWVGWAVAAAAVVAGAALTGAYVAARYEARLGVMARETVAAREQLRREVAELRAAYRRMADLLRDPATRVVPLLGSGPAPRASGRVVWHDTGGGYLFAADLPSTPPGMVYELWTIVRGTPRPAGRIQVGEAGAEATRIAPVTDARVEAFMVTLEPALGARSPGGAVVLASRAR